MIPVQKRLLCIRTLLMAFVLLGVFTCSSQASMYQFKDRLSVIFPNGKVMFYTGLNKGLREGDIYGLFANEVRLGVVQIYDTNRFSSIAVVLHADKVITEGVLYTFRLYEGPLKAGLLVYPPTMPIDGAPAPAPEKKTDKKKEKAPKKEAQKSSRRKNADKDTSKKNEEPEAAKTDKDDKNDEKDEKKSASAEKRTSRKSKSKTRRMAVTE